MAGSFPVPDEGNAVKAVVGGHVFPDSPVLSGKISVVAGEDDYGILEQVIFFQLFDYPAYVLVD